MAIDVFNTLVSCNRTQRMTDNFLYLQHVRKNKSMSAHISQANYRVTCEVAACELALRRNSGDFAASPSQLGVCFAVAALGKLHLRPNSRLVAKLTLSLVLLISNLLSIDK